MPSDLCTSLDTSSEQLTLRLLSTRLFDRPCRAALSTHPIFDMSVHLLFKVPGLLQHQVSHLSANNIGEERGGDKSERSTKRARLCI
jgi:hypothetical protein